MLSNERQAGYAVDSSNKDEVPTSCPAIAKPHVGRSLFKYLEIQDFEGNVISRFDVSDRSPSYIDKMDAGLNRNLEHDMYFTLYHESKTELETI